MTAGPVDLGFVRICGSEANPINLDLPTVLAMAELSRELMSAG